MKKLSNILWGVVLVAIGAIFALNAFGITNIDIFFDGWWTLFIIVPCTIGLFTERQKFGNLIGIAIGVFLLLSCQDIIGFDMILKLIVPAIIVIIGIKLIFSGIFGNKANKIFEQNKDKLKTDCAIFSESKKNFEGEVFEGADITAVFGGVKYDLRNATFENDCVIKACAVFGGIDLLVPPGVNVKVNSTSIFGGISNKTHPNKEAVTLYVNGLCLFGGVDIK